MRNLKRLLLFPLFLLVSLLGCANAYAEVVVVVDSKAGIESLTRDEVINIFLGRHRKLPTGIGAVPADQPVENGLRAEFYRKLVAKDLSEINVYWARLYFSGKTPPPIQLASAKEVLDHIIRTPGGIGYIDRAQVDARVRVVMSFTP
jgi:hypothetical protein